MKKFLALALALLLIPGLALAEVEIQSNGTTLGNATVINLRGSQVSSNGSTVTVGPVTGSDLFNLRKRVLIADVNTGVTLLAAVPGVKYRLVNVGLIAYGGAVTSTTATGAAVSATQSASVVAPYTVAKAQLTQSALNQFGTASTTLLADGASTVANDANTAVTFKAAGGTDLAGATGIDVILTYTME